MLQAPVNEEKLNVSHAAITNALIDQYNDAAVKVILDMMDFRMSFWFSIGNASLRKFFRLYTKVVLKFGVARD